jgi:hypothetical protein
LRLISVRLGSAELRVEKRHVGGEELDLFFETLEHAELIQVNPRLGTVNRLGRFLGSAVFQPGELECSGILEYARLWISPSAVTSAK